MKDLCASCVNGCSHCGYGTGVVFLAYKLLNEERLIGFVNAAKDISISILCLWERSLCLWALCLVCRDRVSSSGKRGR